ncbi:hypothetical protein ACEQ8H_006356 [Pleosporales sp. CAS-2024a]
MSTTRRSFRFAEKRTASILKEISKALQTFKNTFPPNHQDEEVYRLLQGVLGMMDLIILKYGQATMHVNPNGPAGYASSSFIADKSDFAPAQGGFGPPSDVNGSFYHHQDEASFDFLHPYVNKDGYGRRSPTLPSKYFARPNFSDCLNAHRWPKSTSVKPPSPVRTTPTSKPLAPLPIVIEHNVDTPELPPRVVFPTAGHEVEAQPTKTMTGARKAPHSVTLANPAAYSSNIDGTVRSSNAIATGCDVVSNANMPGVQEGDVSSSQDSAYGTQRSQPRGDAEHTAPEPANHSTTDNAAQPRKKKLEPTPHTARRSRRSYNSTPAPTLASTTILALTPSSTPSSSSSSSSLGKRERASERDAVTSEDASDAQKHASKRAKTTHS